VWVVFVVCSLVVLVLGFIAGTRVEKKFKVENLTTYEVNVVIHPHIGKFTITSITPVEKPKAKKF
jgi:hypothetical protein